MGTAAGRRAANAVMDKAQHIAEVRGYPLRSITNDDVDLGLGLESYAKQAERREHARQARR